VTELLISGFFTNLTPIEIASILSCLIYEESNDKEKTTIQNPKLRAHFDLMIEKAKNIH